MEKLLENFQRLYNKENLWYDKCDIEIDALVAQGIEQWFPVPRVGGSNPSGCVICFGESMRIREYKEDKYVRQFQRMALR